VAQWSIPQRLHELGLLYDRARGDPGSVSDAELLDAIEKAFWPTNCWSFVEAAFAMIAPACSMRPHLTRKLIAHPIGGMIAGGLDEPHLVIAQGVACATKADPYVEPTPEGKKWLLEEWPKLGDVALEVFREALSELRSEDQSGART